MSEVPYGNVPPDTHLPSASFPSHNAALYIRFLWNKRSNPSNKQEKHRSAEVRGRLFIV